LGQLGIITGSFGCIGLDRSIGQQDSWSSRNSAQDGKVNYDEDSEVVINHDLKSPEPSLGEQRHRESAVVIDPA